MDTQNNKFDNGIYIYNIDGDYYWIRISDKNAENFYVQDKEYYDSDTNYINNIKAEIRITTKKYNELVNKINIKVKYLKDLKKESKERKEFNELVFKLEKRPTFGELADLEKKGVLDQNETKISEKKKEMMKIGYERRIKLKDTKEELNELRDELKDKKEELDELKDDLKHELEKLDEWIHMKDIKSVEEMKKYLQTEVQWEVNNFEELLQGDAEIYKLREENKTKIFKDSDDETTKINKVEAWVKKYFNFFYRSQKGLIEPENLNNTFNTIFKRIYSKTPPVSSDIPSSVNLYSLSDSESDLSDLTDSNDSNDGDNIYTAIKNEKKEQERIKLKEIDKMYEQLQSKKQLQSERDNLTENEKKEQEQIMLKEIDKMYEQLQSKKQVQSLKGGRRRKKVVSCRKKVVSRRRKVVSRRKKGKKNKSKKMKR